MVLCLKVGEGNWVLNWYFLLQPHKKTSAKPWCNGEMPSSRTLPSSLPHANANGTGKRFCQLNCDVNTNRQKNEKIKKMEVGILVALMPNRGPCWPGSRNGYRLASTMSRPLSGPQNRWRNEACSQCRLQSWQKNDRATIERGLSRQVDLSQLISNFGKLGFRWLPKSSKIEARWFRAHLTSILDDFLLT